jgi:hypothetical protein
MMLTGEHSGLNFVINLKDIHRCSSQTATNTRRTISVTNTNVLCGQNIEFLNAKFGGTHRNNWALQG